MKLYVLQNFQKKKSIVGFFEISKNSLFLTSDANRNECDSRGSQRLGSVCSESSSAHRCCSSVISASLRQPATSSLTTSSSGAAFSGSFFSRLPALFSLFVSSCLASSFRSNASFSIGRIFSMTICPLPLYM